jgi:hypothetical protein
MNCQTCKSDRVLSVGGKCSDMSDYSLKGVQGDGYVPRDLGVGGGDYLSISLCLNCGQTQGTWPLAKTNIEKEIEKSALDPFKKGDLVEFQTENGLGVGEVLAYDRDNCELKIDYVGIYNKEKKTIVKVAAFSRYHGHHMHTMKNELKLNQGSVKKTTIVW